MPWSATISFSFMFCFFWFFWFLPVILLILNSNLELQSTQHTYRFIFNPILSVHSTGLSGGSQHSCWTTAMLGCLLRGRSMSQRLSVFLLLFGLAWCLLLLHYTITQPRHQSSAELRQQILELSQRYVKALSAENNELARPHNPSMAGYGKLRCFTVGYLTCILTGLWVAFDKSKLVCKSTWERTTFQSFY